MLWSTTAISRFIWWSRYNVLQVAFLVLAVTVKFAGSKDFHHIMRNLETSISSRFSVFGMPLDHVQEEVGIVLQAFEKPLSVVLVH